MKLKAIFVFFLSLLTVYCAAQDPFTINEECDYDEWTKSIDCSNRQLTKFFDEEDWKVLIESKFEFTSLDFSENDIREIPTFPALNITSLDLSGNNILKIAKGAFRNLRRLEILDLSSNLLASEVLIPEIFEDLLMLRVLRLDNNNLSSLDKDLFGYLLSLKELYLSHNPFREINSDTEKAIASIQNLTVLDLSYMELRDLPLNLSKYHNELQILNLTGNLLGRIPDALNHTLSLKELYLDENPIQNMVADHKFPLLKNLEVLSLNYISTLETIGEDALSGLYNLKEFHASFNPNFKTFHSNAFRHFAKWTEWNTTTEEWPLLKRLYLRSSALSYLDKHLLGWHWNDLEIINLNGNPWACECENQWMIDELVPKMLQKEPRGLNYEVPRCASPEFRKGQSLIELYENKTTFPCPREGEGNHVLDKHHLKSSSVITIGILATVSVLIFLVCVIKSACFGLCRPNDNYQQLPTFVDDDKLLI